MDEELNLYVDDIKRETDIFKKARKIDNLKRAKEMRTGEVARVLGIKTSYLCHILRLNKLPSLVIDAYYARQISVSHLFVIARLKTAEDMIEVYENVLTKELNSTQTEIAVRERLYSVLSEGEYIPKREIEEFERRMKKLNKKIEIKIVQTRIKGKLILEVKGDLIKSSDMLRLIMEKLTSNH